MKPRKAFMQWWTRGRTPHEKPVVDAVEELKATRESYARIKAIRGSLFAFSALAFMCIYILILVKGNPNSALALARTITPFSVAMWLFVVLLPTGGMYFAIYLVHESSLLDRYHMLPKRIYFASILIAFAMSAISPYWITIWYLLAILHVLVFKPIWRTRGQRIEKEPDKEPDFWTKPPLDIKLREIWKEMLSLRTEMESGKLSADIFAVHKNSLGEKSAEYNRRWLEIEAHRARPGIDNVGYAAIFSILGIMIVTLVSLLSTVPWVPEETIRFTGGASMSGYFLGVDSSGFATIMIGESKKVVYIEDSEVVSRILCKPESSVATVQNIWKSFDVKSSMYPECTTATTFPSRFSGAVLKS